MKKVFVMLMMIGAAVLMANDPAVKPVLYADDFPSLQAAIDALPMSGGKIVLGPKQYKLTKTLNLSYAAKKNSQFSVWLEGASMISTQLLLDTDGKPGLDFTGNAYWKVSNLQIMNRSANVGALLARTPNNGRGCSGTFDAVLFHGCYPVAAIYMTGAECVRFNNCHISNQLKKWYNKDVPGMTEGEACVMISPNNVRNIKSPYCEEGTGGGSNTEYYFEGCTTTNEAPDSVSFKIFGSAGDLRITKSYLHSDGFAAIYLDGTKGNLNSFSARDVRIEGEHGKHALYAKGHVNNITIDSGNWSATKEVILQEDADVAFVDVGGPCVYAKGAANKWHISQLGLSIWDGWGYSDEYSKYAVEMRGNPETTAWKDDEPLVFMRFSTLADSVIEPCEFVAMRWRFNTATADDKTLQTVNGLTVEQAKSITNASFMPGQANDLLRSRMRMIAIGANSAGNRIAIVKKQDIDLTGAQSGNNFITVLRPDKSAWWSKLW